METIDLSDAILQLSSLVDHAAHGGEIVITKAGKPIAKLVPFTPTAREPRRPVNALGVTYIAPDFDGPLPPAILRSFGGDEEPGLTGSPDIAPIRRPAGDPA